MNSQANMSGSHKQGVTLLEVVLAMSLLVILSSMTFWFYAESLKVRDAGLRETRRLQLSRVLLERMATELKQVVSATSYRDVALLGDAERIWFSTVRLPGREFSRERLLAVMDLGQEEEDRFREFDQVKIEYKIARHPEIKHDDGYELPLGLARVELTVPRKDSAETGKAFEEQDMAGPKEYGTEEEESEVPEEGLVDDTGLVDSLDQRDELEVEDEIHFQELYSPEIRFLRFCYYDGNKWWDKWDVQGENPLPQLIQVTIGYAPRTPFGQEYQMEKEVEEFCTCMNEDPVDCEPLPGDQYTIVVRLEQADMFFRSRVARESKALIDDLGM